MSPSIGKTSSGPSQNVTTEANRTSGTVPAKQADFSAIAKQIDQDPAVQRARKGLIQANLAVKQNVKLPAAKRAPLEAKLKAAIGELNRAQSAVLNKINPKKLSPTQQTAYSALSHAMRINKGLVSDVDGSLRSGASISAKAVGKPEPDPVIHLWDKYAVYG